MVLLLKQQEQYQYLVEDQHYMGNVDSRGLAHDVSEKNQDSLGNWLHSHGGSGYVLPMSRKFE